MLPAARMQGHVCARARARTHMRAQACKYLCTPARRHKGGSVVRCPAPGPGGWRWHGAGRLKGRPVCGQPARPGCQRGLAAGTQRRRAQGQRASTGRPPQRPRLQLEGRGRCTPGAAGCAHACTRMHTHMHTYAHTHAHMHACTCIWRHAHTSMYAHGCMRAHAHMHTRVHTHAQAHVDMHTHAHMHTHSHMHRHTHTRAHMYVHTHMHTSALPQSPPVTLLLSLGPPVPRFPHLPSHDALSTGTLPTSLRMQHPWVPMLPHTPPPSHHAAGWG